MPPNENSTNQDEVLIIPSRLDKDGKPLISTRLTPSDDQRPNIILPLPVTVIPIIFIPGIMGTNLQSNDGEIVWRPPNDDSAGAIAGAVGQLFAYFFRGPATRQKSLDPAKVKVDDRGVMGTHALPEELARARGWGAVMRSSYHPLMNKLQLELNTIMLRGKLEQQWADDNLRAPADYGDDKSGAALSQAQLKHAAHYRFDVWGGGYNWLKSNRDSAAELIQYIDNTVLAFYPKNKEKAEKVILVTHSMGGLVARAICNIHGYGKVLGVVHGVMPATGAAATYHHARCGYDGVSSVILGRNAKEVVPVMCNSPGALELIPSADYKNGQPWLKLGGATDDAPQLPKADAYEEIYKSRAWYGLVPAHNEKLLDPAGLADKRPPETSRDNDDSVHTQFRGRVNDVKKFHESISKQYSSPAYAHFGADSSQRSWETVHWQGPAVDISVPLESIKDDHNGGIHLSGGQSPIALNFADARESGDGTVPTTSGEAPGHNGVAASFRQGNQGKGAHNQLNGKGKTKGYDHQGSYKDPRAQWATLYGIIQIAQGANWHD